MFSVFSEFNVSIKKQLIISFLNCLLDCPDPLFCIPWQSKCWNVLRQAGSNEFDARKQFPRDGMIQKCVCSRPEDYSIPRSSRKTKRSISGYWSAGLPDLPGLLAGGVDPGWAEPQPVHHLPQEPRAQARQEQRQESLASGKQREAFLVIIKAKSFKS